MFLLPNRQRRVMNGALANCLAEFGNYWGDRLLAALRFASIVLFGR